MGHRVVPSNAKVKTMSVKDFQEIQDKITAIYAKADKEAEPLQVLADDITNSLRTKTDYYIKELTKNAQERQKLLADLAKVVRSDRTKIRTAELSE